MKTEEDNLAAIACLEAYIESKPDGDNHVHIVEQTIFAIAAKEQISKDAAMLIVAHAFRESLALISIAVADNKNVSIDAVVQEWPRLANRL